MIKKETISKNMHNQLQSLMNIDHRSKSYLSLLEFIFYCRYKSHFFLSSNFILTYLKLTLYQDLWNWELFIQVLLLEFQQM